MKRFRFRNWKMQTKLFLGFLLIIVLIVLLLAYFSMTVSENSIKTQMLTSIQETTSQMSGNIDTEIQKVLDISTQVSSNETLCEILQEEKTESPDQFYQNDRTMKEILNTAFSTSFSVEDVFVCSYNGSIYTADKNKLSLTGDYDFTRTGWFEEMKATRENTKFLSSYDGEAYISTGEAQKMFSIVKKIYAPGTKKELGCMIIDMNSDILGNVLQSINSNSYQQALIIDDNKKIVFHPDSDYIGTQYRGRQVSQVLSQQNGAIESPEENSYLVFSTSEITGWSVLCVVDNAYMLDSANRLRLFLAIVAVVCLAFSVYFARYISKAVSGPVARLQEQMHRVEQGDFDIEVQAESEDEIGRLTRAFDQMVKRTKRLIQNVYQSEIYQKEAELNALQAQINPHFLYNTLQTIDMMAEEEGVQEISDACQALSKIFRYSINKGKEFVQVEEEIIHIKNYMLVQKLRFGDKLEVRYEIEKDCERLYIVKLLIQPLVENAVVHGIENVLGKCKVVIRVFRKEDCLYTEVQDNGNGIGEEKLAQLNEQLEKSSGKNMIHETRRAAKGSIGLENTNARIKLYFGPEYGIKIESTEGEGTLVKVKLPAKSEV